VAFVQKNAFAQLESNLHRSNGLARCHASIVLGHKRRLRNQRFEIHMQQQTRTIPIVITAVGDRLAHRIVKSLARPEGNVTGTTNFFYETGSKWLDLLKQAAPRVERVPSFTAPKSARSINTPPRSNSRRACWQ
jgi:ABC transporter substrate binding protein